MNWAYLSRSVEYIIQDLAMDASKVTISCLCSIPGFVLFDGIKTVFIYQNEANVLKWCQIVKTEVGFHQKQ